MHALRFRGALLLFFTPRSLLRMGYCRQPTRTYVLTSVRPSVRPSQKFLISNDIFGFLGPSHQQFLKIFKIFEKSDFLGRPRPFFDHFFQYIRGYSGRAASQEIYAGMVLFADFESIQWFTRMFFPFFQKKFSLALQIKLKIGD